MPLIVTRSQHTRQPQGAVRLSPDSGLVFAYEASTSRNAVSGAWLEPGAGIARSAGPYGLSAAFSGSQADWSLAENPFTKLHGASAASWDILVYFSSANPSAKFFSQWDSAEQGWLFEASGGNLIWVAGDAPSGRSRFDLGGAFPSAGWYRIQASWYGLGDARLVINGVLRSPSVVSSDCPAIRDTDAPLSIGASGGSKLTGQVVFARVWRRGLSLDEMSSLYGPGAWRIFAPIERRIWVPSASSAVPSITAVYADSVTASSVVPRVTLDYA